MNTKHHHLTADDRVRIEALLGEGASIRYIADRLDMAPSTISREIKKHSKTSIPKSCDCIHAENCSLRHVCGNQTCMKKCKSCPKAKAYCQDYAIRLCDSMKEKPLKLCNGCPKHLYCHLQKRFYEAKTAQIEYRDTLVHSRDGFDLTGAQFQEINRIVSPLIGKGQSVYHIVQTNKDTLPVSESTIRRLVRANEMDVILMDFPEAVKRKQRRKKQEPKSVSISPRKTGRLYSDFLAYISAHDTPVVQMDCVEGKATDTAALLTLHFTAFHMQLIYILSKHDSANVVRMLDSIELSLGKELFRECFPLILTDNGHEFSDIESMERSIYGGRRTRIYFCEPNRSDEKGACENNHKLIRRVIPKGTSIEHFLQKDMVLLTNHINSYSRKALFGKCPYDLAAQVLPRDFFILLGLEKISPENVILKPSLLSK